MYETKTAPSRGGLLLSVWSMYQDAPPCPQLGMGRLGSRPLTAPGSQTRVATLRFHVANSQGKEFVVTFFGPLHKTSRVPRVATLLALVLVSVLCPPPDTSAGELSFGEPQFLPGDAVIGSPAGMQVEVDIASGGDQFLAVWSDGRSTPDNYWPFATEGSGTDIYGARLDAAGNVIDIGPFMINQNLGDQIEPRVAWNGQNWLVVWKQETATLPTYEELRAVRVAPDGTVLDDPPIVVHNNESYYSNAVVEGGGSDWVVLFQTNGPADGLHAVRIAADGAVVNPGGLVIHETLFLLDFDLAFAQDEYLIIWGGSFDTPRGRRYTPDLQPIGTSVLPFARRVASDGTDFVVVYASGSPPLATVEGVLVTHDGSVQTPFTLFTGGNQDGTCCADATWDGTYYWVSWGGPRLARVTPDGQILDPGGFIVTPATAPISTPHCEGVPGGGVQLVYNNGVSGADYPKDIYSGQVSSEGLFENETLVSRGAPAQLDADFAEGAGTHLIVFRSRVSDSGRILAQRVDATGNSLDPEPVEVATGPIPGLGLPSLGAPAAAWNGSVFMITWSDGLEIFARRMLPDGNFVDGTPLTVMDGHDPDVAAVGQVFLVVGLDFLFDNPEWQATHSMRVDGVTGQNLDAEPNALGGFVIFARYPHVVNWGDRWLVVWQLNLSHDDTIAGTTAAVVDADGTTPAVIDVPLGWRPDVAVSNESALFVAVTNTVASATTDLAGIIMTPDGTFSGTSFTISEAPDKQLMPAATWNGSEFIVAWEDKRNSVIYFDERTDIYGSRVDGAGNVLDPAGVPLSAASVPEIKPALLSIGTATLLGVSTLRTESQFGAYRIGIQVDQQSASVAEDTSAGAPLIRLLGAHPNPTDYSTTIRFESGAQRPVDLHIFSAEGRLVRTLIEGKVFGVGVPIEVSWDGRDDTGRWLSSGVYFYRMRSGSETLTRKMTLRR